jgi:osmoprotectant transport system substrate-binding protein
MTRPRPARLLLLLLAVLSLALAVGACGGDEEEPAGSGSEGSQGSTQPDGGQAAIQRNAENARVTLTIGSKNFTEQQVLGQVYAQALQAAGYTVETELNLGDEQTALRSLRRGTIDAYPEYTGTALLSFFEVPTEELPSDPQEAYQQVRTQFARDGITAMPPTPFTSSNEIAVTRETAERLGLRRISDLQGEDQDLVMYGSPECRQRLDCLLGLQQVYDLDFRRFVPVDIDQRHEVLQNGDADVSVVFTTDPQIARNEEVLLEDDRGMFPPYNSTLLVRDQAVQEAGADLQRTVELVNRNLNARVMQELNARVDLDRETPEAAARAYLEQFGLVGGE